MADGLKTFVAQQINDEIRSFGQKLIDRKRNGLGKMGISASGSINASTHINNHLGGSGLSGSLHNALNGDNNEELKHFSTGILSSE